MRRKLIFTTAFFAVLICIATVVLYYFGKQTDSRDMKAEQIVAVNEIEQLAKEGEYEQLSEKTEALKSDIRSIEAVSDGNTRLFIMGGICILLLIATFGYVYFAILRPFDKMKQFADKIAQGNFDIPLNYERSNYFGAFTWAFDSMRREITKARSCEKEAIENNKTVIATLSHDIKTPISSIRAYAEGLDANMDTTPEKRRKYLETIMNKCDEVSRLTNDLFLHSLADLDKLKINSEQLKLCSLVDTIISELAAERNDIGFMTPQFEVMVYADRNRLIQIVENLINNARKYAKSDIKVSITKSDDRAEIHIRDYGTGISDEDMPFIFHKFYRGRNCGDEQGSGLGLYIVKYLMEQMNGEIFLHNHADGLEAIISLPIIIKSS